MVDNITEYNAGQKTFEQAAYDSVIIGVVTAATFTASLLYFPSIGGVKLAMGMTTATPSMLVGTGLAVAVHATAKPSADVEHLPFGAQKVTPRLGWKLF